MVRIPFPPFGAEDAADDVAPDAAARDVAPDAADDDREAPVASSPSPDEAPPLAPNDEAAHADAQHEAKRADTAVVDRVDALLDGGEHPFMAAERDEAVRRAPHVLGQIKGIVEKARQGLTPAARAQFDQLYAAHRLPDWNGRVQAHAAGQDRADRDAVSATRRDQALAVTKAALVSDPARAEAGLAIALGEDHAMGTRNGHPPDRIAETQRRTRADALADGLEHAIHSRTDLAEVQRRHDAIRDQLDPARSARIDAALHRHLAEDEADRVAGGLMDGSIGLDGHDARDLEGVQAAARALAGDDPVRREAYAQSVAERWSAEEEARRAARQKPIGELQPHLLNPEIRSMADLPRGLVAALPEDARQAARDFYAGGGRFPATSDPMTAFRLAQLRAHDPEEFAQAHPTPHARSLSRDDYQALLADQQAARAGAPEVQAGQLAARRLLAVGRHALIEAGGRDAADDPEVAAGFHAQLQDAVALYRHEHGGQAPDDDQLERMAGKLAERAKAGGAAEGGLQTAAYVHPGPNAFDDATGQVAPGPEPWADAGAPDALLDDASSEPADADGPDRGPWIRTAVARPQPAVQNLSLDRPDVVRAAWPTLVREGSALFRTRDLQITFFRGDTALVPVVRRGAEYFTSTALTAGSRGGLDMVINAEQYDLNIPGRLMGSIGAPQSSANTTAQGQVIENGRLVAGRSSPERFYVAKLHGADRYQFGKGDPPRDAIVAFGGGTPLIVGGLKYGPTNLYRDGKRGPLEGDPGRMAPFLVQRSNAGLKRFAESDQDAIGKIVLAYDPVSGVLAVVAQPDRAANGASLAHIRDALAAAGFRHALVFDGSDSVTLVRRGRIEIAPGQRKNSTITTGMGFKVPRAH